MNETTAKAPTHLMIVGIVALLWSAFGATDYTMTKLENMSWLGMMSDDPAKIEAALVWMRDMPLWANIAWGVGVWGGLAGAILLLMKNRHAVTAYLLSLLGAIGGLIHMYVRAPLPEVFEENGGTMMMLGIVVIALALFLYARSMASKGHLN